MNGSEIKVDIQQELFALQDLSYRDFHAKLMPTVDKARVIGVRTPKLRAFAKEFGKTEEAKEFLKVLPHQYYEENNLHGLLIEQIKDYPTLIGELNRFLPCIDNWATCDLLTVRVVKKHLDTFTEEVERWLASDHTCTIRFGIGMLMRYYIEEHFHWNTGKVAKNPFGGILCEHDAGWYFATALAKQYEAIFPFLEEKRLDAWTHNKTIQKAIESYRITQEQKVYLRTLRIK